MQELYVIAEEVVRSKADFTNIIERYFYYREDERDLSNSIMKAHLRNPQLTARFLNTCINYKPSLRENLNDAAMMAALTLNNSLEDPSPDIMSLTVSRQDLEHIKHVRGNLFFETSEDHLVLSYLIGANLKDYGVDGYTTDLEIVRLLSFFNKESRSNWSNLPQICRRLEKRYLISTRRAGPPAFSVDRALKLSESFIYGQEVEPLL